MRTCCALKRRGASHRQSLRSAPFSGALRDTQKGTNVASRRKWQTSEPRKVDPVIEESHWREHYAAEPYYDATYAFEDYLPAWRTGWEGIGKYPGKSFEPAERDLSAARLERGG